jgi:hypothetical protein
VLINLDAAETNTNTPRAKSISSALRKMLLSGFARAGIGVCIASLGSNPRCLGKRGAWRVFTYSA